jgi:predicted lysophospholipase L1 biosynthesis ABC-type transport system permease subunit
MALGAQARDVIRSVVGQGMKLALIGMVIGLGSAWALTRWMKSLLFGVSAADPLTFALVAGLLTVVALLACRIPGRRAARVDPTVALRMEQAQSLFQLDLILVITAYPRHDCLQFALAREIRGSAKRLPPAPHPSTDLAAGQY